MASLGAAELVPLSVVVAMAARWLCGVLACLPSDGPSSFRYLLVSSSSSDIKGGGGELAPVALYTGRRTTRRRRCVVGEEEEEDGEEECVFCLSGIEEGSEVRELRCRHVFHRGCLDRWVRARPGAARCPLCRGRLVVAGFYDDDEDEDEAEDSDSDMMLLMACVVHSRSTWLWPPSWSP